MSSRLPIQKTYKLYIDGKFPRSESNRYYQVKSKRGKLLANASRGSRKDIRDAVRAARKAQSAWQERSPFNRGQILYRAAEMLESRKETFVEEITTTTGVTRQKALQETALAVDRLVWYAGWADKYVQIFSSINPVAASYWNFTSPEATGVVGIIAPEEKPLLALVSKIAPAIVSGNTVVVIPSTSAPLSAISFAEVLATSDFPAGVVNIVTGSVAELLPTLAQHMDVNAIDYSGHNEEMIQLLQESAPLNLKRIVIREHPMDEEWFYDEKARSPYWIEDLVEMKTAWHPVGV